MRDSSLVVFSGDNVLVYTAYPVEELRIWLSLVTASRTTKITNVVLET